ncbi:MAG: hypothetical protein GXY79_07710 [Chloroflexi bacterium]|nr:hypothetical protein [Chloroflexota bacterium]
MNEVLQTILTRRAIRRYTAEQVPEEVLEQILQAGLYAPAAGGRQSAIMVVCRDRELNDRLGRANRRLAFGAVGAAPPRITVSHEQPSIIDDSTLPRPFMAPLR